MRASPRIVVAAAAVLLAPLAVAGQSISRLVLEEVTRGETIFVAGFGTSGRCSVRDEVVFDEVVRVLRRYQISMQPLPPAPEAGRNARWMTYIRTPTLFAEVTGIQADSRGRGCALSVSTKLSVARPWIPAGEETMLLPLPEDEAERAGRGTQAMLALYRLGNLRAAEWETLLIAPRDERERDVQRVVETHVSEIAEALNHAR